MDRIFYEGFYASVPEQGIPSNKISVFYSQFILVKVIKGNETKKLKNYNYFLIDIYFLP